MPTTAPPQPITNKLIEARRRARTFRAQGETELADRWDDKVNEILDHYPR